MKDHLTEADTRIVIDDLLRQARWDPADKSQVLTEISVRDTTWVVAEPVSEYGSGPSRKTQDGDEIPTGRADYVLMDRRGRPIAIVEAKRSAIEPYTAKQQALPYAKKLGAPFIFLTNGELIYFWDYGNDDARIVNSFFSRRDLDRLVEMRATRKPLATVEIPEYYLRQGETRRVRPYQGKAMQALDHALELGKRRFLIELPTGTGKTDLICLYLKRLIRAGLAERILFLVDREQLAKQAIEAIQDILNQYSSYWLRPGIVRQEQQITVCLLQTMIGRYMELTSGYFDVVVADEYHRSIYCAWQTALTHFDALHVGLTATPSVYMERNTFQFYQCRDGQPDFAFPIQQAFQDSYLVPYKFATGITIGIALDDQGRPHSDASPEIHSYEVLSDGKSLMRMSRRHDGIRLDFVDVQNPIFQNSIHHRYRHFFVNRHRAQFDPQSIMSAAVEKIIPQLIVMKKKFILKDWREWAGELFKTTLEKALFSSPWACLATIHNRVGRLRGSHRLCRGEACFAPTSPSLDFPVEGGPSGGFRAGAEDPACEEDLRILEEFARQVERITPEQFSKYQKLLQVLRDTPQGFGWTGKDPRDRLVIFTEALYILPK